MSSVFESVSDKDKIAFVTQEEEQDIVEEKEKAPLRSDLGEAVGPDGEIDWDCPCLQGMTDGPCGEKFKAAFACFVYSQEEDKGSDCIEQFKEMHDCLNEHSDYYLEKVKDKDEGEDGVGESDNVSEEDSSESSPDDGGSVETSNDDASSQ